MMRSGTSALIFTAICIQHQRIGRKIRESNGVTAWACELEQAHNGCKINGSSCSCGFGCRTEFIYRTRRACLNAMRERSSNICNRMPCVRGICIQTMQDPGFTCKCEGTGFYGQRCENACPTALVLGMIFPHECIVI